MNVVSFGYKYGLPVDADIVADCRFLPNPRWVPELRPLTGKDEPVRDYVLSRPGAAEFLDAYLAALGVVLAGYEREGKRFVTLAIGCTGGKHRSVAIAEQIAGQLSAKARPSRSCTGIWGANDGWPGCPRLAQLRPSRPGPADAGVVPSVRPLNPKVAALGGGHGLFAALSALRRVTRQLTAIVTVADDGGSSGRLRRAVRCPAAR